MPNSIHLKRLILYSALLACLSAPALATSFRTPNFIVTADTRDLAQEIAERAEDCRKHLAFDWLGIELPPWDEPCVVSTAVGDGLKVRGQTTFIFDEERATQWEMRLEGPRSVLLRSVVPHEVMHAVFTTHFGRRLPWWAEEGACVSVEHEHERADLERLLPNQSDARNVMLLEQMFSSREYPSLCLASYAQAYSLVSFLLAHGGKRTFAAFLEDGIERADWPAAAQVHYGHTSLQALQKAWFASTPALREGAMLVSNMHD